MPDTCTYNCSAHPTEVNAYGDISGIGVTTAFFATAWMLVLLLIGYYLVAYNPELDPFRQPGKKTPCQHPNATDYIFLYAARKLPGLRNVQHSELLRSSRLESALNQCVMTFADIQIFTSLAVMISGYIALSCGLQSYHWQLMVYLVWLASLTHLAALSFLRNHLAHQPGPRIWRVTAMFFILVLLAVAVGLAGYFVWDDGASKVSDFAICYFGKKMNTKSVAFESMIKTLILLAYGFFIRVAKMSKAFEGGFRRVAAQLSAKAMRLQHGDGVDDAQQWDPHGWLSSAPTMPRRMMRTFFIALCSLSSIHLNFLTSFLAEVYWLSLSALWVTRRYFKTRRLGPEEENEWTFGQVLPVLLVVAPLAAIFEHLLPFRSAANRRRQRPSQIALEIVDQLERDEAQDDVQVDLNQQHINSPAYRGTSFLTAVAYIEAGIFFIVDQSPGIRQPAIRLGASFFILNPLLQLLWIHSVLWISCTDWSCLVKKTVRWATFTAFMAITVNEFILAPLKGSRGDKETLYGSLTSLALVGEA
ncbi:hypothetical protein CEP51_008600 [Fusarium floridanum]|uniref:Uncharacterized protein n=1 Tax=Fusarium floridanum TaxID=1325733 RepID=A0A428RKD9_9HYPO|nr:hypothetical protein CEP51_008600 [Fusarium floridanum]